MKSEMVVFTLVFLLINEKTSNSGFRFPVGSNLQKPEMQSNPKGYGFLLLSKDQADGIAQQLGILA